MPVGLGPARLAGRCLPAPTLPAYLPYANHSYSELQAWRQRWA